MQVLSCLKILNDRFKPITSDKQLYKLFFSLRKHGYVPDIEFEDNINPISLNLDRLIIGYKRNQLISTDPIKILPEGERLVKNFLKTHENLKEIKNLKIDVQFNDKS